jgi:tetratricopeptide (TPR) repeat protein
VRGGIRAALAGLVLLAFGLQSARLAATWNSDLSLFGRAAALTGENFIAEVNYGAALARAGRTEEALVRYRRAISFNPRYADAHFNLAPACEVRRSSWSSGIKGPTPTICGRSASAARNNASSVAVARCST